MAGPQRHLQRRVGWSVGALAVAGVAAIGARGSFGLFVKPWEEAFGASRGSVAAIFTLNFIAAGIVRSRSGIAFGVLTAAGAGGQVIVLPIATAALGLSLRLSLLAVAAALAVAFVAVLIGVHDHGQEEHERSSDGGSGTIARTPGFWLLLVPFFICGYTSTGLTDTHLIPYATDHHIAEATASAALVTLAAFNVVGVLVAGFLTDRVDRAKLLAVTYSARAASLFVLPALTSAGPIFVFAAFFGLADFATVPPTTSLTRTVCKTGGWGFALGLIGASHQVGSALGAWLGGWLFTRTGSYDYSFSSAAVALLLAAGLSYLLRGRGTTAVPEPVPATV